MYKADNRIIDAYYYPTTVVFLDDHQAFLNSIPLALESNVAYKAFVDSKIAIDYINNPKQYSPLEGNKCILADDECSDFSPYRFKLDIEAIQHKPGDNKRFFEPSILVADYAMPGSNGLEVCRSIKNPYVKKILLTGVADEQVAIEALNDNVIDYYLKKSQPDVFDQINRLIQRFQHQYFARISNVVRESVKANCQLIDDPLVVEHFYSIIERYSIVEYYLQSESGPASMDFLMLTDTGESYRLLVLTDEDFAGHAEVALDAKAPTELINNLVEKNQVPQFPTTDGFYHPDLAEQWQKHLYPVSAFGGNQNRFYFAFIKEQDMYPTLDELGAIFSFQQHLQTNVVGVGL